MPEIIADGSPFQTPLAAAEEGYSRATNPGLGAFVGANLADAATGWLARAGERGTVQGSSFFDRFLANSAGFAPEAGVLPPEPTVSPDMAPEQYNQAYAPRDAAGTIIPIGDKPMPEALAKIIGQQKAESLQRESVLSRYAATHAGPTTFAVGTAASMLDPLNVGALFVPGIGEGALATRLGGGLAARIGARVIAGAETGAAFQAPFSALKLGLAPEEASDYGMRDAMRELLYAGVVIEGAVMKAPATI